MLIRVGILCNVRSLPHCAHYVLLWSACNCDSFYGLEMCFINTLAKRCVKAPRTRRHFAAETPLTLSPCPFTSPNPPYFLLLPSPTCFSFTNECVWLKRQPKEMMHRAMYTGTHTHTYIAIELCMCLCVCVACRAPSWSKEKSSDYETPLRLLLATATHKCVCVCSFRYVCVHVCVCWCVLVSLPRRLFEHDQQLLPSPAYSAAVPSLEKSR